MALSYVICAAGAGERFRTISTIRSKPFLQIQGKTLIERSLLSLPLKVGDQMLLLHRFSAAEEKIFQENIAIHLPIPCQLIKLAELSAGQAVTALMAESYLDHAEIAIFNIDTYFQSHALLKKMSSDDCDGVVPCFKARGNSWSFFKTSSQSGDHLIEYAAEKLPISEWASVGFYHFKKAESFFREVKNSLNGPMTGEMYIAPYYNKLIKQGQRFYLVDCEIFKPMGTVEQIEEFWHISKADFLQQNKD